jgi:hypothetical protein
MTYIPDPESWGPLLLPGQPDPGGFEPPGGGGTWQGEISWRTQHGPATVLWSLGHLAGVLDARLPDGSRTYVQASLPGLATSRMLNPHGQGWIHGDLALAADDVTFAPFERNPPHETREEVHEALACMLGQPELLELVRADYLNACALYSLIQNQGLTHRDGMRVSLGQRTAASLVAGLREAFGEGYLDYFNGADDLYDDWLERIPLMRDALERAGFVIGRY